VSTLLFSGPIVPEGEALSMDFAPLPRTRGLQADAIDVNDRSGGNHSMNDLLDHLPASLGWHDTPYCRVF
jgi:hypothetical protein